MATADTQTPCLALLWQGGRAAAPGTRSTTWFATPKPAGQPRTPRLAPLAGQPPAPPQNGRGPIPLRHQLRQRLPLAFELGEGALLDELTLGEDEHAIELARELGARQ